MPDIYSDERNPDAMRKREAAVRAQHAASVVIRRRGEAARNLALLALSLGCAWLVYSNGELATKAASRDTVYAVVQRNGEVISSTHYADLPPNALPEESIQNTLWMYVQSRDCFGSFSPVRQYYMALAMSDERVGKQVKDQFLLTNAQAPQHVYGDHGVTVQCDLVDPPAPIGDPLNHQYLFRFRRWEQSARSTPADQTAAPFYTVTVQSGQASIRSKTPAAPGWTGSASTPRACRSSNTPAPSPKACPLLWPGGEPMTLRTLLLVYRPADRSPCPGRDRPAGRQQRRCADQDRDL